LANATFIAPEYLENCFLSSPLVDSIWIYAESDRDYPLAVICPNRELLESQCASKSSFEELCEDKQVKLTVLESLKGVAKEKQLQSYEEPRDAILEPQRWSAEEGTLTVSYKLSRMGLTVKYRKALHKMYVLMDGEGGGGGGGGEGAKGEEEEEPMFDTILKKICRTDHIDWNKRLMEVGIDSVSIIQLSSLLPANSKH